jgi:1-acyl-sn-glycerol-3-phosphate acyltransferase
MSTHPTINRQDWASPLAALLLGLPGALLLHGEAFPATATLSLWFLPTLLAGSAWLALQARKGIWLALLLLALLATLGLTGWFPQLAQPPLPAIQLLLTLWALTAFLCRGSQQAFEDQAFTRAVALGLLSTTLGLRLLDLQVLQPLLPALAWVLLPAAVLLAVPSLRHAFSKNIAASHSSRHSLAAPTLPPGIRMLQALSCLPIGFALAPFFWATLRAASAAHAMPLLSFSAALGALTLVPSQKKRIGTPFFPALVALAWFGLASFFPLAAWEMIVFSSAMGFWLSRSLLGLIARFRHLWNAPGLALLISGLLLYCHPTLTIIQRAGAWQLFLGALLLLWLADWNLVSGRGLRLGPLPSRLKQAFSRMLSRLFFRKVYVEGRDQVPPDGPFILVANHPNTFFDPLLLTAYLPGPLHYLAKATLWKVPVLGALLDRLGAIPVARQKDGSAIRMTNEQAFARALQALEKGHSLLIFPEGVSESGLNLKPLKTGAARLALLGQEKGLRVPILPVAIDYAEPGLFRSAVTLRIAPLVWAQAEGSTATAPAEEANPPLASPPDPRTLTERIAQQLRTKLPCLKEPELETLVRQIEQLYGSHLQTILGSEDPNFVRLQIAQAVTHYQELDPLAVKTFSERLNHYLRQKQQLETPENHAPISWPTLLREGMALKPFHSWGLAFHMLPYQLTRLIVLRFEPGAVWLGTFKLCVGVVVFLIYYFAFFALSWLFLGGFMALLLTGHGVASGLPALTALDGIENRTRLMRTVWQAFWTQNTDRELDAQRLDLIQDLERFREAYSFHLLEDKA